MRRISDVVEAEVLGTPFLEQALSQGLINHAALARRLKPSVEKALLRPASEAAIMMALKRLKPRASRRAARPKFGELTVRSHLVAITYQASPKSAAKIERLFERLSRRHGAFVTYTRGISEVMVVVTESAEATALEAMAGEHQIARLKHLAAIVIRLVPSTVKTPGVYYAILKQLAWRGLNVVDVVSTYTEFTIVIEHADVDKAFSALREALSSA